jgi:urease accessory protein
MIGIVAFAVALTATAAHAHGSLPGSGGFYAGALHPLVALEHLLLLLALGLQLGSAPDGPARAPLIALAGALGTGLLLGLAGLAWPAAPLGILTGAVLAGAALAAGAPLGGPALALLAAAAGLATGLDTGVPSATWTPQAGVFLGVFLIVLNAMAAASVARRPPWGIAVRVVGSWVAAAALMMLAMHIRRVGVA